MEVSKVVGSGDFKNQEVLQRDKTEVSSKEDHVAACVKWGITMRWPESQCDVPCLTTRPRTAIMSPGLKFRCRLSCGKESRTGELFPKAARTAQLNGGSWLSVWMPLTLLNKISRPS